RRRRHRRPDLGRERRPAARAGGGRAGRLLGGHADGGADPRRPLPGLGRRGMNDVDEHLRVGGLAPPDAVPTEPADAVVARSYRPEALGARPVVRLVAEALGRAEDLTLAHFGFELAATSAPVALTGRRELGFPGWVLLHHPEDARQALAVVQEMASLARLARS